MAKEKKLGIKYILNKELKSSLVKDKDRFPVYTRLTFNRKNTKFPSNFTFTSHGLTEKLFLEIFEEKKNTTFQLEINQFESDLKTIVQFEYKVNKDLFSIIGINKRLDIYYTPLNELAEKFACERLMKFTINQPESVISIQEKKSISKLFNESYFFDGFEVLKTILPNLKENMSKLLIVELTAAIQLVIGKTDNTIDLQETPPTILDWIRKDSKLKKEFKDSLFNPPNEDEIFKNESLNSSARIAYREFKTSKLYAGNYIEEIDNMIFYFKTNKDLLPF